MTSIWAWCSRFLGLGAVAVVFGGGIGLYILAQQSGASDMRTRIEAADPKVVPVLRRWLAQESDVGVVSDSEKLRVALWGVGQYRDAESAPLAAYFYGQSQAPPAIRQAAADALAAIGSRRTLPELKRMVWDPQMPLATRCDAAAALVQLDESLGRRFLLLQYDLYRLEFQTAEVQHMAVVRSALQRVDDAKIIEELKTRIPHETGKMRNNITTLISQLEINAESVEQLAARVADPTRKNSYGRYDALAALGRKGSHQQIPMLQSVKPWTEMAPDAAQQVVLRDVAKATILEIRRRCWEDD